MFTEDSMPAVVSPVDVVSKGDDVEKPGANESVPVGKCPFAHGKKSATAPEHEHVNGDDAKDNGKETDVEKEKDGKVVTEQSPLYFINLILFAPGCNEPISLQVSSQDTVQDIRQVVLDRPESCFRTCMSLYLDGKRLDDFAEIHSIEELKDGDVLKMVEEPYSVREARIHVRRLRDLLSRSFENYAYSAVENLSLSFCVAVSGVDIEEDVVKNKKSNAAAIPTEECTPPPSVLPSNEEPLTLDTLFPKDFVPKLPLCVKELSVSSWNPPPGYRKLAGDLLYVDVITLEDDHVNVTSCPSGFFVNRSENDVFNPQPRAESHKAHTLVGLLSQLSPLFKKNFAILQKASVKHHPLEVIPTPYQVFPWAVPKLGHTQDRMRAEDSSYVRIGHEEHMPGQLRDWNEEIQSARELPRETLQQRLLRDRAIFKITTDFIMAATRGAMFVVDGNVMSINPGDDEKSRMYIWNNIFYSLAFDNRSHFKALGGDDAAYAAAGGDLRGVTTYNRADVEGLHTLGTIVVDYRGYRVIAQTIIPGILQRDQENSVIYGSIDEGKVVPSNPEFLKLLSKAGKILRIRPHTVVNENDEECELASSVECKGILGADGRHYILDLFRTYPTDTNFLEGATKSSSALSNVEETFSYPTPYKTKLVSLRPELIESFITARCVNFLRLVAKNVSTQSKENEGNNETPTEEDEKKREDCNSSLAITNNEENVKENSDENIGKSSDENVEEMVEKNDDESVDKNGEGNIVKNGEESAENIDQQKIKEKTDENLSNDAVRQAALTVGSISETECDIRFNPDAYNEEVKHAPCEIARLPIDKDLMHDASAFLSYSVLTNLIKDFINLTQSPLDGACLTEILHHRGINIRYLGKITSFVEGRDDLDHVYKICVSEMILRAAKKYFKIHLRQALQQNLATAVSHFLNCLLSSFPNPMPSIPNDEITPKKKKNKKNKNKQNSSNEVLWAKLTPTLLWSSLVTEIKSHFGFNLKSDNIDDVLSTYVLQPISLLRSFCLKTGVQVLLCEYEFNSKKAPTFTEEHIMNMFPIVKHTNPKAYDAATLFEASQAKLQAGFLSDSHTIMVEALNLYHQVYGPLHADIAVCYRQIARLYYMAANSVQAVLHQRKAVVVCERVYGFDHPDTIMAYFHLALYTHDAGMVSTSLKLIYRARYLALLVFGEGHPDMATFDSNIGLILQGQREYDLSVKFLQKAVEIQQKYIGPDSIHTAMSYHLLATAKACTGDYRSALQSEKSAFSVYQKKFGSLDTRSQESSEFLKQLTQQAVKMQRKLNELSGKGKPGTISEVTVPQGNREEISRLMGFIAGLQESPARRKEEELEAD